MSDLDPLLRELFAVERERPDPAEGVRDRVLTKVASTVGLLPPGGGQGGGGHGSLAPLASSSPSTWLARPAAWLASAFVAGGLVGAGVHATLVRPQAPHTGVVPATQPRTTPSASAPPLTLAPATEPPATAMPSAPSAPARVRAAPRDVRLAEERALLEVARTALARGQPDAAFESLEKHRVAFPNGRLAEEREVLAVQALAHMDRGPEARERAARFRRTFPDSILLPAVEASLQTIP